MGPSKKCNKCIINFRFMFYDLGINRIQMHAYIITLIRWAYIIWFIAIAVFRLLFEQTDLNKTILAPTHFISYYNITLSLYCNPY